MQDILKNEINKYDSKNVFHSIALFPNQCLSTWNTEVETMERKEIKNILVLGMGGSALGAYMLQSLNIFSVPISISHEYTIPKWVTADTLVLAMSYSGGTEETLSGAQKSIDAGAQVVCITGGGKLQDIATTNNLELRTIDVGLNPCGQPRFGVGSMMMEIIKVSMAYGVCILSKDDIQKSIRELVVWEESFVSENKIDNIFTEAQTLSDKMPVLVYSEHLTNLGRFARNQIHETAKTLALTHEIPELNHHLMEGLEFPQNNKEQLYFIFHESNLYGEKINKRIAVTKDVLSKQGIQYATEVMQGSTQFSQVLIGMLYAMYRAFILGIIHEKDPSDIPWVNYFKDQLSK